MSQIGNLGMVATHCVPKGISFDYYSFRMVKEEDFIPGAVFAIKGTNHLLFIDTALRHRALTDGQSTPVGMPYVFAFKPEDLSKVVIFFSPWE